MTALKSFPITHLKIDRTFIDNLSRDPRDRSIARAVISMAKTLHLRVIAEGVESDEQLAFLKANDCDEAQGFLISRPVSPDAIGEMLQRWSLGEAGMVLHPVAEAACRAELKLALSRSTIWELDHFPAGRLSVTG